MTKMTKMIVVIASSLLVSFASIAGELSVTGSAKASYTVSGGVGNNDNKGLGISNELNFAASGELDNGYTWNYHMELDPAAGGATTVQDDTALTLNTNGMGTVGIFDSEGGLSTELGWGIGALGTGQDYANTMGAAATNGALNWGYDVSSYTNLQYHTPADILPLGLAAKIGFAPNLEGQGNSFKSTGGANATGPDGDSLMQYQLSAAPIDGLKIGGDYASFENTSGFDQEQSGANAYAQYAIGNVKIGYMQGYTEKGKSTYANGDGTSFDTYEYDALGIELAVNDALSVSYSKESHEAKDKGQIAAGNASRTTTVVTSDAESFQVAYNIGGATLGLSHTDTVNSEFTTGKDEDKTIASIAMEF